MGRDPSFQIYPRDYLASDLALFVSLEHQGAMRHLECHAWIGEACSLPDDDTKLAVYSKLGEGWFNGGSQVLRAFMVPHPDKAGFLTIPGLHELWLERQAWREKSADGGRKSAAARELKRSKGGSTTVASKREPRANSSNSYSNSNSSTPNPSMDDPDEAAWKAAAEEVFETGVSRSKAQTACTDARGRGCTTAAVREVVAYWRAQRPAWGHGGLVHRLENLMPGEDPGATHRWPPRDETHRRDDARAKSNQRAVVAQKEREAERERLAREYAARVANEKRYGPELDALGQDARNELLIEAIPNEKVRRVAQPNERRLAMIEALAARNGVPA